MQQSNTLDGIDLKPTPTPNPDGSYTIKLTPAQWAKFQENQANLPASTQPAATPATGAGDDRNLAVSKDPSMTRI